MEEQDRTPSLRSQHAPVQASQDHPYLGRDPMDRGCAIYTIVESLQQLGLESRAALLLSWLGRFEGLERHLEDDADPVLCVRQMLLQHVIDQPDGASKTMEWRENTWHDIVCGILRQSFLHACIDWSKDGLRPRIRWNPLEQTFLEFLSMGLPDEELSVWTPTEGTPKRARECAQLLLRRAVQ
ncbi:hypothetical protein [Delftia sp. PS-11]|uniref:hypothetical protein n=1 Tax=Delftia sp. PS-11 TaxID=2767222 RepID=UPI0024541B21|nr:hypothetical protein [Delftia sp. PS-11]KAJ8744125.1 hypothetical protein H9T68_13975 [Delftia sp. PS-11]